MGKKSLTLFAVCATLLWAGAAVAQPFPDTILIPFPPPMQFINNGSIGGTLQTQGMTLPITGILDYLSSGGSQLIKAHVSVDTGGQQITTDSWVTSTPTVINEWEIVSTDPTTCRKKVLYSYPQCTPWNNPSPNQWSRECTISAQGNTATLGVFAGLNGNLLNNLQENTTNSITEFIVDSQGSFPPDSSTFALPSICSAPNGNNQGDNNQGDEGECTSTIPSICL